MKNIEDLKNIKIENNSWNICEYAYENCEEAKDPEYFNKYCLNNEVDCPIKPLELPNKFGLNLDY